MEDEFKKERKKKTSNTPKMKAEIGLGGIHRGKLLRRRGSVSTHSNFKAEARQKVAPPIFVEAKIVAVDYQCEKEANRRAPHMRPTSS